MLLLHSMKFLVLSDLHTSGKFDKDMFYKGAEFINKTDADYYIMAGDLTDSGTFAEYKMAIEEYLPRIEKPLLMIPGNHDVKNSGFLLWEELIGPRHFIEVDEERKVKIIGIDSNEPDRATGRIGETGIQKIYKHFEDLDDSWLKVLVFHHQTLPIKYTGRERSALYDAGDVIKAILDCNIDLVINGHRHISNVYTLSDGDLKSLIVNCGTMSSKKTRYRSQNTLTLIDIAESQTYADVSILPLNADHPQWNSLYSGGFHDTSKNIVVNELISTIVHIGNTHFSDDLFDLNSYNQMVQFINSLNSCDVVLHNGNITGRSYLHEFEMAQIMLNLIQQPLVAIPGPRDYYALGKEIFPEYIGPLNPTYENDIFKLLGFNTCILQEKIGSLGRSRTKHIINDLHSSEKLGIVAFYHNIIPLHNSVHESELQDAGDVLSCLVTNRINLVLTAAKNRASCWQVGDTVFVNTGTMSSHNIVMKEGHSINLIKIFKTSKGKLIQVEEYFVSTGNFYTLGKFHILDNAVNVFNEKC